ncbi:hypothetical protein [Streptomyces sp. bgisy027]|uniref:hypothetical protein n=1 Tax=Streptomyces sp. bgisy027 TaxID=3413770 RepID=UPI003D71F737
MLETIALHEPLEAKNEFFAWPVAETFLNTNGVVLDYEPEDASRSSLAPSTKAPACRQSQRNCASGPLIENWPDPR